MASYARSLRSGERDLLAQASPFRLSESSSSRTVGFCNLSLRWDLLAWARLLITQNEGSSPKWQFKLRIL